ncbi:ABC-three component system protein [Lichenihabitans psoromatis]|uniref:ABC-three component system protein n=1 Tax=Lichenihabitans psoromatis TaxID=2528642 RepID=UPI001035E8AD|nr:ABC-three component system protein [Lichenihabitans psoromatis]
MNALTQTGKHSAAGQYLGYSLQPVRLCFHLLNAPDGASVSLEHLDDVAVHLPTSELILEQSKSALKQNPLSDWAGELWKTLANWLSFIAAGEVDPLTTKFRLYVTPVKIGAFAQSLSAAITDEAIQALLKALGKSYGKLKSAPGCDADVKAFLAADAAQRSVLIKNLEIISTDVDPVDAIRAIFKPTVSPLVLDLVCERAIGAAKEGADRLIRAGKPAIIDAAAFQAEQRAFVQKNNLPGLLSSFTKAPSDETVQQLMEDRPAFVRQLELIEAGDEACLRAVSDYLRTLSDVSVWGERGLIFEKNLTDWDDDLVGRHEHIAAEVKDVHAGNEAASQGRIVYRRCALLQPPLDGRVVPGHFVHGSYNSLSHDLRLGWHPQFKTLMGVKP